MILGIIYINVYPDIIHKFPNRLQILRLQFLPSMKGEVCCIGGALGNLT